MLVMSRGGSYGRPTMLVLLAGIGASRAAYVDPEAAYVDPSSRAAADTNADAPWPIVYLNNSIGLSKNAVCLDGTPAAFYVRRNASSTQWRVFFQGGGWCYDADDCATRATSDLGSSAAYPPTLASGGSGMMSTRRDVNPTFWAANTVYLKYCDGDSFSGARDAPVDVPGGDVSPLHFRGQAIVDAALETLRADFGLADATELVLTGCSAGGLATFLHADSVGAWARANLPALVKYGAVPVSGNFLRRETVSGAPVYPDQMATIFNLSGAAAGGAPAACLAAKPAADAWQCNFAREAYASSASPIFVLDSSFDSWQSDNIMTQYEPDAWRACSKDPSACTAEQMWAVWAWQGDFATSLTTTAQHDAPGNGAFVYACHTHCSGTGDQYATFEIGGTTMAQAVDAWWRSLDAPEAASAHTYFDELYDANGTTPNPTC